MSPTASTFDIRNGDKGNSIISGNYGVFSRVIKNRNCLIFAELVSTVSLASILSTFSNFVDHVNWLIAEKKVIWIDANRVIAGVQNMLVGSDFAAINDPCNSVCALSENSVWPAGKLAVAAARFKHHTDPKPTCGGFFYMRFEGGFQIDLRMG